MQDQPISAGIIQNFGHLKPSSLSINMKKKNNSFPLHAHLAPHMFPILKSREIRRLHIIKQDPTTYVPEQPIQNGGGEMNASIYGETFPVPETTLIEPNFPKYENGDEQPAPSAVNGDELPYNSPEGADAVVTNDMIYQRLEEILEGQRELNEKLEYMADKIKVGLNMCQAPMGVTNLVQLSNEYSITRVVYETLINADLEKATQILVQALFTEEELLSSTLSGRSKNKHGAQDMKELDLTRRELIFGTLVDLGKTGCDVNGQPIQIVGKMRSRLNVVISVFLNSKRQNKNKK